LKTGAEFLKQGLPYDNNNFTCNEDCWNRSYQYLDQYKLGDIPEFGKHNLKEILQQSLKEGWGGDMYHLLGQDR
jgi:hypothetical protein